MALLHGILAELGIEKPAPLGDDALVAPDWIKDRKFDPVEGTTYELAFTRIPASAEQGHVLKRVRIDGPTVEDWFDLERQAPLERELYAYAIKAFRRIDAEPNEGQ
jgi:hypothetical protein